MMTSNAAELGLEASAVLVMEDEENLLEAVRTNSHHPRSRVSVRRMRFPHSLHWRIAIAYTILIFLTMGVVSVYLVGFVRNTFISNLERRLEQELDF